MLLQEQILHQQDEQRQTQLCPQPPAVEEILTNKENETQKIEPVIAYCLTGYEIQNVRLRGKTYQTFV